LYESTNRNKLKFKILFEFRFEILRNNFEVEMIANEVIYKFNFMRG